MQVQGSFTTWANVNVDPKHAFRALSAELLQRVGIKRAEVYIHNGRICTDKELHTSHSWVERVVIVEEPTEDQLELVKALSTIRTVLQRRG